MSGKHSPGPWKVYPAGTSVPGYDVCDRIVADSPTGRSSREGPSDADAALIAAAPDLLEVVEEILRAGNVNTESARKLARNAFGVLEKAREAVLKARGQAPIPKARGES